MSERTDTPVKMAAIGAALVRAEAIAALSATQCHYPELFEVRLAKALAFDPETVTVHVVDDQGNRRHGVTVHTLAAQLAAEFNARYPGRFFGKQ